MGSRPGPQRAEAVGEKMGHKGGLWGPKAWGELLQESPVHDGPCKHPHGEDALGPPSLAL